MGVVPGCGGGDAGSLTSFSIDGEYTSDTLSARRGSILPASVAILMVGKPHREFSRLVFDLPPALASTVSSCRSALGTRAQIRDLRIDSRGSLLWSASVTAITSAGELRSKRKSESSLI